MFLNCAHLSNFPKQVFEKLFINLDQTHLAAKTLASNCQIQ